MSVKNPKNKKIKKYVQCIILYTIIHYPLNVSREKSRSSHQRCSIKKAFLREKCFPVNFGKSLRIHFYRTSPCDGSYSPAPSPPPCPSPPYSSSYNLTLPLSRVLIGGRHLIFCLLTSPTCCGLLRKCAPVKHKAWQKTGFPIAT